MEQKTAILIVIVAVIAIGIVLVVNPQLLGKASGTTGNTLETNPVNVIFSCIPSGCGTECSGTNECILSTDFKGRAICSGWCDCAGGQQCGQYGCNCAIVAKQEKKENKAE